MESSTIEALGSAGVGVALLVAIGIFIKCIMKILDTSRVERAAMGEQHERAINSIADSHKETMSANTTAVTELTKTITEQRMENGANIKLCETLRTDVREAIK